MRWITMSPSNSPLYAFATSSTSKKDPTTLLRLLLHSSMNAAEHRCGYYSLMYDPSVTATSVPSEIDFSNHVTPPDTDICSHSHVFPQDCSTSKNKDSVGFCVAHGAMNKRHQCSPSKVSCTEHIILCARLGWLWEYVNWFGFCLNPNMSSVLPLRFMWWRVVFALLQNQRHILCKRPVKRPTGDVLLLLGQIEIMASLHSLMSESVGCSLGHLIIDHASPWGHHARISAFTLLPEAVSISDMNSNWRETLTLFRWLSDSSVYPALTSTCMINWSPSLGNSIVRSAMTVCTSNIDSFPIAASSRNGWLDGLIYHTIPVAVGTRDLALCTEESTMFAWTVLSLFDTHCAWGVYLPSQSAPLLRGGGGRPPKNPRRLSCFPLR